MSSECSSGRFGVDCRQTCEQCSQGHCHRDSGMCLSGCVPGFHGDFCKGENKIE